MLGADNDSEMPGIEELSEMFRRMPVALYRTTAGGEILAANPALANLLGYDSVEAMKAGLATVESVYVDPPQRDHRPEALLERPGLDGRGAHRSASWPSGASGSTAAPH